MPTTLEQHGDWVRLISRTAADAWPGGFRAIDVRVAEPLPEPAEPRAIIVTGSASSVTERAPWMLRLEEHLRHVVSSGTPVLGICFGHQILGQALGGRVERNPRGREIGTVEVELTAPDPILDDRARPFLANMTHVDTLVELPEGARVLARTALEAHAALRFGENAWGVQFHPEIDAEVMRQYVSGRRELIAGEGLDAAAIHARIRETPPGAETLRRFLRIVAGRSDPEAG
jgi:GMP synthase (glutamine-hydrolysing)